MNAALSRAAYLELLSLARRHARGRIEAEDLLQEALAAALAAGRAQPGNHRAWLGGVMRNIALMHGRSAARRRRREERFATFSGTASDDVSDMPRLDGLAPSLRIVAMLALSGHSRAEIRHLLRISDEALRQRIAGLRRHWRRAGETRPAEFRALRDGLAFGMIRRSLLPLMRRGGTDFASHDPDGHPMAFTIRRPLAHKIRSGGNCKGQES